MTDVYVWNQAGAALYGVMIMAVDSASDAAAGAVRCVIKFQGRNGKRSSIIVRRDAASFS